MDLQHDDSPEIEVGAGRMAFGPGAEGLARLRGHAADDVVAVTVRYTEADLRHAMWNHIRHGGRGLTAIMALAVVFGLLYSILVGLVYGLTAFLALRLICVGKARRLARREAAFAQEHRWTIGEEGLTIVRPDAEGSLRWGAYQRIIETREAFLLYPQSQLFHVLPKRCMDPEQIEQVRGWCAGHRRFERRG